MTAPTHMLMLPIGAFFDMLVSLHTSNSRLYTPCTLTSSDTQRIYAGTIHTLDNALSFFDFPTFTSVSKTGSDRVQSEFCQVRPCPLLRCSPRRCQRQQQSRWPALNSRRGSAGGICCQRNLLTPSSSSCPLPAAFSIAGLAFLRFWDGATTSWSTGIYSNLSHVGQPSRSQPSKVLLIVIVCACLASRRAGEFSTQIRKLHAVGRGILVLRKSQP